MVEDDFTLLENARKFVDTHPELYLQLLEMKIDSGEDEKMLAIGQEAMDAILSELIIRIRISNTFTTEILMPEDSTYYWICEEKPESRLLRLIWILER